MMKLNEFAPTKDGTHGSSHGVLSRLCRRFSALSPLRSDGRAAYEAGRHGTLLHHLLRPCSESIPVRRGPWTVGHDGQRPPEAATGTEVLWRDHGVEEEEGGSEREDFDGHIH